MIHAFVRSLAIFLPAIVLAACGQLPGFAVSQKSDTFQQSVTVNTKIDLLFVVDNSASTSDKQAALAANFTAFINQFTSRGLDYHIGVISTDMTGTSYVNDYWTNDPTWITACQGMYGSPCPVQPYAHFVNNGPATLLAYKGGGGLSAPASGGAHNDYVLTSDSPNLVAQFQQNVQLGDQGSGAEMGILSTTLALAPTNLFNAGLNVGVPFLGSSGSGIAGITLNPLAGSFDSHGLDLNLDPTAIANSFASGANVAFLRSDALLSVIEITDEDESEYEASYVADGAGRTTKVALHAGLYTPDAAGSVMNNDDIRLANLHAAFGLVKPGHPELTRFDTVTSPWDGATNRAATNADSTYAGFDHFKYYGEPCAAPARAPIPAYSASTIGVTVGKAATQNNGTVISICSDFGVTLAGLGGNILTALTQFHLLQPPVGNQIQVTVNGQVVTEDITNGWTYDSTSQLVSFHGTAVPPAGASISVAYVPTVAI